MPAVRSAPASTESASKASEAGSEDPKDKRGKKKKKDSGTRVEIGADGLEVEAAGGDFKLRLGGRLQVDAAFHEEDAADRIPAAAGIGFEDVEHRGILPENEPPLTLLTALVLTTKELLLFLMLLT